MPSAPQLESVEQEHLQDLTRIIAGIEALLMALVLLSLSFAGVDAADAAAISAGLFAYAALALGLRYAELRGGASLARIRVAAWAMVPFATWAIWFTDKLASPLFNAYLVIVIASALTLGLRNTLWQLGLIAACCALLGEHLPVDARSAIGFFGSLLTQLTPLIVVGYATSVFRADIRYWMNKAALRRETDALTGLPNMRGFALAADRPLARAIRKGAPVAVLVVDAGGEPGERAPRAVAGAIRAALRQADVLASAGDGRFVALLADSPPEGAQRAADRMRAAAPSRVWIGLAAFSRSDYGIDAALAQAAQAARISRDEGGDGA